jgi:aminobenzoyl-glutamate utilization protein B
VSGGSDDIGDVSWVVPTVTLRFPSNVDGLITHHWSSAMAMATPIAHKGATAGAKVVAATLLDLLLGEQLRAEAWRYLREEQLQGTEYEPFIGPGDSPPTEKNAGTMAEFRERLRAFYYDPAKFATYLEQLGIDYPQLDRRSPAR